MATVKKQMFKKGPHMPITVIGSRRKKYLAIAENDIHQISVRLKTPHKAFSEMSVSVVKVLLPSKAL